MRRDDLERLLVGIAAGAIAARTMSEFQNLWIRASGDRHSLRRPRTDQDLMAMIAGRIARKIGVRLNRQQLRRIGLFMHYSFGSGMGAAYSVAAGKYEGITRGFGAGFASAYFAIADSLAPRQFKPSVRPHNQRIVSELYEWLAHLVYGVTLEAGRRVATLALSDLQGDDELWDERFAA